MNAEQFFFVVVVVFAPLPVPPRHKRFYSDSEARRPPASYFSPSSATRGAVRLSSVAAV